MNSKTLWAAALAILPAAGTADARQAQPTPMVTPAPTPAPGSVATPTPSPVPSPSPPLPSAGLDDYSLPAGPGASSSRPVAPTDAIAPAATPTPRPSPVPRPSPSTRATVPLAPASSHRASPARPPVPSPMPSPTAAPVSPSAPMLPSPTAAGVPAAATPSSAATGERAAPPDSSPATAPSAGGGSASRLLSIVGAIAIVASAMILLGWALRRRRGRSSAIEPALFDAAVPAATPVPVAPARPAAPRARLAVELVPVRGGLTIISMVFEGEILVRNDGPAAAGDVRVAATLLPARSEQDAELGALFARPIARPAAPPFALAPGEERRVRVVAALPLAGVEPLLAGGRPMLVPVVAVSVTYAAGPNAEEGQSAASWIVGVAREGSVKLAPFWMDTPRMHETIAARPHALAITR